MWVVAVAKTEAGTDSSMANKAVLIYLFIFFRLHLTHQISLGLYIALIFSDLSTPMSSNASELALHIGQLFGGALRCVIYPHLAHLYLPFGSSIADSGFLSLHG